MSIWDWDMNYKFSHHASVVRASTYFFKVYTLPKQNPNFHLRFHKIFMTHSTSRSRNLVQMQRNKNKNATSEKIPTHPLLLQIVEFFIFLRDKA